MCLNCLPYFEKCVFCISLKAAAVLISLSGLFCTICLIVLTLLNRTGLNFQGAVNSSLWFICIMLLWLITFIILLSVWTGLVQNETGRDVLLQIYFWLSVVTGVIQLIFCAILFVTFWDKDLTVPIVYISTTLKVFCVWESNPRPQAQYTEMCDIFPEVYSCFFIISIRVGMLLISIIAIMTGVITLSTMQMNSNINYKRVKILSTIRKPKDAMKNLSILVTSGICMMSCVFMFSGLMLLFGTLIDNDGLIQIFVWVTFLNIVFGYLLVFGVGYECMVKTSCILSKLDWLSGAAFLVFITGYLSLWIYFISIANSYVMSVNV